MRSKVSISIVVFSLLAAALGSACGDDGARGDGADADADVTPDETVTVEDVTTADEVTGCMPEMGGPCNIVLRCGCALGERCILGGSATAVMEECAAEDPTPTGTGEPCTAETCEPGSLPPARRSATRTPTAPPGGSAWAASRA